MSAPSEPAPGAKPRPRALILAVDVALVAAAGLLVAGIFAPLLTVKRLLFFSDTFSLATALTRLLDEGQIALFALLLGFSVLFPIAKLLFLLWVWNARDADAPGARRALRALSAIGRWSMLDVFVAALLVVTVKLRWIADVEVRHGLYLFGGSVLLTLLLGGAILRTQEAPDRARRPGASDGAGRAG